MSSTNSAGGGREARLALDLVDEARRQQRMPADLEEVVEDAHLADAEQVLPDAGEHQLEHVARRHAHARVRPRGSRTAGSARRSSLPLALSGSDGSQTIDAGSMYSGRMRRRSRQRLAGGGPDGSAGDDVGDELARVAGVAASGDGRGAHLRQARERGLDLVELDAVAADLDLAVARPRNSIAPSSRSAPRSPVRYRRRGGQLRDRALDEALGRQLGRVEVAERERPGRR